MLILGISEGPGAAAALVRDGALVAAVAQERIDRQPRSAAFPSGAIDAVLDRAGVRAREVDRVVIGGAPPTLDPLGGGAPAPGLGGRAREWWTAAQARPRARDLLAASLRASGLHMVAHELVLRRVEPKVRALGFDRAQVSVVEEDRCQSWAAYRCQGADPVLIVLLDEAIDGAAVSVSLARHGQVDRLHWQTSFAPLCGLVARLSARLGVDPAALGEVPRAGADRALVDALAARVGFADGQLRTVTPRRGTDELDLLAVGVEPARYVAAALVAMEEAVLALVRAWMERTGVRDLALAGTVFAQPWLVGRVLEGAAPRSLFVAPDPGAGAAAVGAALGEAGAAPTRLPGLALGPSYSEQDCYRALSVAELPRDKADDPVAVLAGALAAGRTVARFAGPAPLGAAPLGARSVLYPADRAPAGAAAVVPAARLEALVGAQAVALARAGVVALPLPAVAAGAPGLATADGLVRPVVGDAELEAVLTRLDPRGGAVVAERPLGRPLVTSPGDAVRAWREDDADLLLLGPYVVDRAKLASQ